tara:strand:- start:4371 stop:9701 length:5331 start_codon:yes stop_codon:yes gene_type:complete
VSSSDGSNVGTVQNMLGNTQLSSFVGYEPKCVGAIADDKNNALYWFIKSQYIDTILEYKDGVVTPVFVDISKTVLKFTENIITGINIIDDLLFWTDNYNEPKKINIKLCKQGTNISGSIHTNLVVPERNITSNDYVKVREEHITVIKKSPKKQLTLIYSSENAVTGTMELEFRDPLTNQVYVEGDVFNYENVIMDFRSNFEVGGIVLALGSSSSGSLPEDVDIRLEVIANMSGSQALSDGSFYYTYPANTYKFKVLSVDGDVTANNNLYNLQQGGNSEKFFDNKFVRFSYRYKYQDGEYSCYAPFSEHAFVPDIFNYDTKKAYNTGMDNHISELELVNFRETDILENVVEIEILYKESNSPLVYSVDKIKANDFNSTEFIALDGSTNSTNYWNANKYRITSDLIYAVLPENQLFRPFDNVPRRALAQEITGNRVVYGNYLQNYNLPRPLINAWRNDRYQNIVLEDYLPKKSIKSLREYQLGVAYLDSYGRETSVFSNPQATFKIPKIKSEAFNSISTSFQTEHPSWASSFKFYLKETSGEFYNLSLDRVYEAEDGNLWLAFPSSERNKIDDETFLILKKAIDGSSSVTEEAKYKVISIENQAPTFIKTLKKEVLRTTGDPNTAIVNSDGDVVPIASLFDGTNSTPQINSREFVINKENWLTAVDSVQLTDLTEISNPISITFADLGDNRFSKEYRVSSLTSNDTTYTIVLEKVIDDSDSWIYPDLVDIDSTSSNTSETGLSTSLSIIVHQFSIENRAEFEGRFFIKIYSDDVARQYIFIPSLDEKNYETLTAAQMYYFSDTSAPNMSGGTGTTFTEHSSATTSEGLYNHLSYSGLGYELQNPINDGYAGTYDVYPTVGNISQWGSVLNIDNTGDQESSFFIDQAYFRGEAPLNFFERSSQLSGMNQFDEEGHGLRYQRGDSNSDGNMSYSWLPAVLDSTTRAANDPDFKQGVYEENGQWYIEIAFSTLDRNPLVNEYVSASQGYSNEYQVYYGSTSFNGMSWTGLYQDRIWQIDEVHEKFVQNLRTGTIFTFDGDKKKAFYKIVDNPQIFRRYNHTSAMDWWYAHVRRITTNTGGNNVQITNSHSEASGVFDSFIRSDNRRVTYKIPIQVYNKELGQVTSGDPLTESDFSADGVSNQSILDTATATLPVRITFLKEVFDQSQSLVSDNPAIFETLPKKSADLDIYYEASQVYPTSFNDSTSKLFIEEGMEVSCEKPGVIIEKTHVLGVNGTTIRFDKAISNEIVLQEDVFKFTDNTGAYIKLKFHSFATATDVNGILYATYLIFDDVENDFGLGWYNCYSFANGVESNRIRDDFNQVTIDKGAKASAPVEDVYKEEKRSNGLIYSGIYNSTSGVNNLNQFIQAEKITKDLNPTYGSIQKLFSRQTDLVAFCEDRVVRIQANKDAIFNADGNPQLIASNKVLGQTMPFAGDFGISKNPESFAKENYRAYFTDRQRGSVLRLSMDGLTPISEYGMSDYFSDNLKLNNNLLGSYDGDKNEYNLTLSTGEITVSFDEKVKGWTSFRSFVPEESVTMSNNYYTFKDGQIYLHHVERDSSENIVPRNNFYGVQYNSSVEVLLNEQPSIIKNYKTLNYEGTDSRIIKEATRQETGYHNIQDKDGWYSSYIKTNENEGNVPEFIKKEGKWFNFIKGNDLENNEQINTEMFSFQGLGQVSPIVGVDLTLYTGPTTTGSNGGNGTITNIGTTGCMDPNAINYDPLATIPDNSLCTYSPPPPPPPPPPSPVPGCTNPLAINYDPLANVDDGSCVLADLTIQDTNDDD